MTQAASPGKLSRVVEYLGLHEPDKPQPGDQVPLWWGWSRKKSSRITSITGIMAIALYFGLKRTVPANDGLLGLTPVIISVLAYAVVSLGIERYSLRFPLAPDQTDTQN